MGALKRGDETAALTYAEKASAVAPQAAWAAETAHNLQVKSGKIEAAIHSLNQLSRSGGMAPKAAQRRRAALLTEQARRILAGEGGDVEPRHGIGARGGEADPRQSRRVRAGAPRALPRRCCARARPRKPPS